jgi:hypothetical protein
VRSLSKKIKVIKGIYFRQSLLHIIERNTGLYSTWVERISAWQESVPWLLCSPVKEVVRDGQVVVGGVGFP